jgi:TetR/AcrR family acrAB operon transcriptional repressor
LSRGAIYWHFKDKADLFNAMMERVILPMEESLNIGAPSRRVGSIEQLRLGCIDAMRKIVEDPQIRRVFEIAIHKVEYVDELQAVRDRRRDACKGHLDHIERTMAHSIRHGELSGRVSARTAALGLHSLLEGLLQNWMLDPGAFDLVRAGTRVIDTYLAGLALPQPAVEQTVAGGRAGGKKPPKLAPKLAPKRAAKPATERVAKQVRKQDANPLETKVNAPGRRLAPPDKKDPAQTRSRRAGRALERSDGAPGRSAELAADGLAVRSAEDSVA